MSKSEIAKKIYEELSQVILHFNEKYKVNCELPICIKIDSEVFYSHQFRIFTENGN